MGRTCSLSPHQLDRLDLACVPVYLAFPDYGPYLVGSVMRGGPWRDVDVRVILTDERYDELFTPPSADGCPHDDPLWLLLCRSTSEWLSQTSGLPVDFQIQRHTEATATYSGEVRNPMGRMRPWSSDGQVSRR